jgi:CheY-like chemotaxis protein
VIVFEQGTHGSATCRQKDEIDIDLPRQKGAAGSDVPPLFIMSTAKPTVIVVDDDLSMRRALGRQLRHAGFNVLLFESAESLLAGEFSVNNSCLLLDMHMPGMSGVELCRHLAEAGRRLPTVLMTGRDDEVTLRDERSQRHRPLVQALQRRSAAMCDSQGVAGQSPTGAWLTETPSSARTERLSRGASNWDALIFNLNTYAGACSLLPVRVSRVNSQPASATGIQPTSVGYRRATCRVRPSTSAPVPGSGRPTSLTMGAAHFDAFFFVDAGPTVQTPSTF